MKFRFLLSLCYLGMTCTVWAQKGDLSEFGNLIDKTWKAEGKWGDGSLFRQEVKFDYDLGGTLVVARSKGFIGVDQTEVGDRNHGIRKVDPTTGEIEFWEFDAFGGLTQGVCEVRDGSFYYHYDYETREGTTRLTDAWIFQSDTLYVFKVGVYEHDEWKAVFLETEFVAMDQSK